MHLVQTPSQLVYVESNARTTSHQWCPRLTSDIKRVISYSNKLTIVSNAVKYFFQNLYPSDKSACIMPKTSIHGERSV